MKSGTQLIADERAMQVTKGYDEAHDAEHHDSSIVHAAIAYALHAVGYEGWSQWYPWGAFAPGHANPVRGLTIAGALIAAEIDRRIRQTGETVDDARVERIPEKLWLWRNHVDGRPEYWAFDNPFPVHMDNDDPQTLGEPCGYALVKPSRNGRPHVQDAEVLAYIKGDASNVLRPEVESMDDDQVYTLERLAAWLEQKYKRHGEECDRQAAEAIRAFRKAADAIMAVSDEAESFGIAHDAIVPFTRWKRASAEMTAAIEASLATPASPPVVLSSGQTPRTDAIMKAVARYANTTTNGEANAQRDIIRAAIEGMEEDLADARRYRLLRRLHRDELVALAHDATSEGDFDRRMDEKLDGLDHAPKMDIPAQGPDWRRLFVIAIRAVIAQQRGQHVNYYGTEVQIRAPKDQGMEAADLWCAIEEAGLEVEALLADAPASPPKEKKL